MIPTQENDQHPDHLYRVHPEPQGTQDSRSIAFGTTTSLTPNPNKHTTKPNTDVSRLIVCRAGHPR